MKDRATYDRDYKRSYRTDPSVREKERLAALSYRHENLDEQRVRDREGKRARQQWLNELKESPCSDCKRSFPPCVMDFDHRRGEKVMGIGEMLGSCKPRIIAEITKCDIVCACCHRLRTHPNREATANPHRRKFYAKVDLLKDKPCIDCGVQFHPVAMDFDHVRGKKVASIAQMRSFAWGRVLVELAKCELVCANCHRIRTTCRKQASAA